MCVFRNFLRVVWLRLPLQKKIQISNFQKFKFEI
jgi:hypothetical protein